ncbi:MAG: hypothetical protein ACJ8F7_01355 [Gemmataceae bacterium]
MPASCPICSTAIAPGDLDTDAGVATCRACSSLTSLGQPGWQAFDRPPHFFVKDRGHSLRIGFCWVWSRFLNPAMMCLMWNSIILGLYWSAWRNPERHWIWFVGIFLFVHLMVGVLLVYATLAGLLNRTVVKLTPEFLTVWNGPLPWWGDVQLPLGDLRRLYCGPDSTSKKSRDYSRYRVSALMNDLRKVELVTGLDSAADGLFIIQELERSLNADVSDVGCPIHR